MKRRIVAILVALTVTLMAVSLSVHAAPRFGGITMSSASAGDTNGAIRPKGMW